MLEKCNHQGPKLCKTTPPYDRRCGPWGSQNPALGSCDRRPEYALVCRFETQGVVLLSCTD